MTQVLLRCFACILVLGIVESAQAEPNRYTMTPTGEGALRLDTQTGAVSHCTSKGLRWVCESVADEQAVMRAEIEKLARENRKLKADIATVKANASVKDEAAEALPLAAVPPKDGGFQGPGDDEIDQMMAFMEKMARRLRGMVEDLKREHRAPPGD